MAIVATGQSFTFRSVHRLQSGAINEGLHGHRYVLEVTSVGCAPEIVAKFVRQNILPRLDKQSLNGVLPVASGECLVEWIHARLTEAPCGVRIVAVALQETRKNRFASAATEPQWL